MTFNTLATLRQMLFSADILHLVDGYVYSCPHQDIYHSCSPLGILDTQIMPESQGSAINNTKENQHYSES